MTASSRTSADRPSQDSRSTDALQQKGSSMLCPRTFNVNEHELACHRPAGHDGKHKAVLDRLATIHWDDQADRDLTDTEEFVAASNEVSF